MGKHFTNEFKEQVVNEYKSGCFGGYKKIAKQHNLSHATVWKWILKDREQGNQENIALVEDWLEFYNTKRIKNKRR